MSEDFSQDFEEKSIYGIKEAKRASIVWTPWMGDWFVSHSPRNGNSNAEGTWDHWVQVALSILQHPATEIVRPEVHAAVKDLPNTDLYSESTRLLDDDELRRLFVTPNEDD